MQSASASVSASRLTVLMPEKRTSAKVRIPMKMTAMILSYDIRLSNESSLMHIISASARARTLLAETTPPSIDLSF